MPYAFTTTQYCVYVIYQLVRFRNIAEPKINHMRIFILLLASIAIYSTAFYKPKCEHVFTQVEQANIKIERPSLSGSIVYPVYSWPSGLQEGKDLICVKCLYKQKQILDYGQPCPDYEGVEFKIPDSWRATTLTDTCITGSAATILKKGDTLIWSTVK